MGLHLDELVAQSQRPGLPAGERHDINSTIWNTFVRQLEFPDPDEVRAGIGQLFDDPLAMSKAVRLDPQLIHQRPPTGHEREHTSILYVNEFGLIDPGDGKSRWLEKRSIAGFEFLRDVAYNVDLIGAIKQTRQRQIHPFLRPERDQGALGFRFVRVDGERTGDGDDAAIGRLEAMLLNGGDVDDYFERRYLRRDGLTAFVSKFLDDSLTADACPIELTYTAGKKLSSWHAVPFNTVRLCAESGYEGRDEITAVQVLDALPRVAYTYRDLLYEVRNPRTDLFAGGYGFSETEGIIKALTGYMNTVAYNAAGVDRNATPRGVMTLLGDYDSGQLEQFKRQMKAMLTGASNRFVTPVMAAKEKGAGAIWTPMDTFNEMFFARLTIFYVSIICAWHGIDPTEVHFDSFAVRGQQIGGKTDTETKLTASRDKGLIPLLTFVERIVNILVHLIDPRYRFEFVGLHEDDPARKQERLKLCQTVNEMREVDGAEPHPDELIGNAPVNPTLLPLYMQEQQLGGQPGDEQPQPGDERSGNGNGGRDETAQRAKGADTQRLKVIKAARAAADRALYQPRIGDSLSSDHEFLVVVERGDFRGLKPTAEADEP